MLKRWFCLKHFEALFISKYFQKHFVSSTIENFFYTISAKSQKNLFVFKENEFNR